MKEKCIKKKEKNQIDSTAKTLLVIFIILIGLVVFLGVEVLIKKKENADKTFANLVVPVIKTDAEQNVSINVSSLLNNGEYILKITNYRGDDINKEEIPYSITVSSESSLKLEVTKDYSDTNLVDDSEVIEGLKVRGGTKQDVYFHIKLASKDGVSSDDKINVKIVS